MTKPLILIADDDAAVREALCSLMRCLDYQVLSFADASLLLQSPQLAEAHCVISDVQMPGLDGFGLLAALQQSERPVPVVLFTAFYDDSLHARALAGGVLAFLTKPVSSSALLDALQLALTQRR